MPDINNTIKNDSSPKLDASVVAASVSQAPAADLTEQAKPEIKQAWNDLEKGADSLKSSASAPLSTSTSAELSTSPSVSISTSPSTSPRLSAEVPLSAGSAAPMITRPSSSPFGASSSPLANNMNPTATPVKQGNVDIYAMPKEFQKHNAVAGSNFSLGVFVMLGGLVLLFVVASGVALYYLKPDLLSKIIGVELDKKGDQELAPVALEPVFVPVVVTTTSIDIATSTEPVMTSSTPAKDVYLAYNIELGRINTFSDYFVLINKYGTARRVEQLEAEKLLADASPDKGVSTVAAVRKAIPILDPLARITEVIDSQTTTINVLLTDNVSKGVIDMIWEGGAWKLDNENWILPETKEQLVYVSGEDRDSDTLTDKEEDLLGTNKESTDTDADGYSDAVELSGLYDPNKKAAKLVDSGKFGTYLDEEGYYSIIRPSQWPQAKDNTDNSVSFRSTDDHYIKISAKENFNKESLETIYTNKFGLTQIDNNSLISNDTWNGIMSPDGTSIYVMSKLTRGRYYVLEYGIPAKTVVQEYKQIFLAMIKSLVLKK